jgi:hypothetical protein
MGYNAEFLKKSIRIFIPFFIVAFFLQHGKLTNAIDGVVWICGGASCCWKDDGGIKQVVLLLLVVPNWDWDAEGVESKLKTDSEENVECLPPPSLLLALPPMLGCCCCWCCWMLFGNIVDGWPADLFTKK